jgi:hypothetical protein
VYQQACAALFASFAAGVRELALERMTALHTGVLIATFRSAPSARCGAFADARRIVASDEGGREGVQATRALWASRTVRVPGRVVRPRGRFEALGDPPTRRGSRRSDPVPRGRSAKG